MGAPKNRRLAAGSSLPLGEGHNVNAVRDRSAAPLTPFNKTCDVVTPHLPNFGSSNRPPPTRRQHAPRLPPLGVCAPSDSQFASDNGEMSSGSPINFQMGQRLLNRNRSKPRSIVSCAQSPSGRPRQDDSKCRWRLEYLCPKCSQPCGFECNMRAEALESTGAPPIPQLDEPQVSRSRLPTQKKEK